MGLSPFIPCQSCSLRLCYIRNDGYLLVSMERHLLAYMKPLFLRL
ncbi:hypothetical protein HMPREF9598_02126 [Cutibacterium acnes HL050PA1]|nr:hypothetical protein HMPREF9598_02126 [Cutibacterium acnes HL050PA1]EGE95594.1 hypothetical protein HMPREF9570_00505 [Cutibacterium acnes HL043PA1]